MNMKFPLKEKKNNKKDKNLLTFSIKGILKCCKTMITNKKKEFKKSNYLTI